jgi:hypothetical protein
MATVLFNPFTRFHTLSMTKQIDPEEIVQFSVSLREALLGYLNKKTWTPVEGAMLLAGLRPPEDGNCNVLPADGGIGLDGTEYNGTGNIPFSEARSTLKEWQIWCDDWTERVTEDGRAALFDDDPFVIPEGAPLVIPDRLIPFEFIKWFVEFQVKERTAELYDYRWVSAFKELIGYPSENPYAPFGVALYSDRLSRPLDVVLVELKKLAKRSNLSDEPKTQAPVGWRFPKSIAIGVNARGETAAVSGMSTRELAAALADTDDCVFKSRRDWLAYLQGSPAKWATDPAAGIRLHAGAQGRSDTSIWHPLKFATTAVVKFKPMALRHQFFRAIDERFRKVESLRAWREDWIEWVDDVYRPLKAEVREASGKPGNKTRR